MNRRSSLRCAAAGLLFSLGLTGCAVFQPAVKNIPPGPRTFDFATDTLALPTPEPKPVQEPEPLSAPGLRGHVDAGIARQFFLHARFEPVLPPPATERRIALVRAVLKRDPNQRSAEDQRVVIPGYENLREFSRLQGHLLRAESWLVRPCEAWTPVEVKAFGGRDSQKSAAANELAAMMAVNRPALVRLYRHRVLKYDRSLLLFSAQDQDGEVRFQAYDPASPAQPVQLSFNRAGRTFTLSDDPVASGPALAVEIHGR